MKCFKTARRPASGFFLIALLVGCLQLSGCATPMATALSEAPPAVSRHVELVDTPFFPQVDALCGPAALATVLQSAGGTQTPEVLAPQVYLPGRKGSLQLELLVAARRQGVLATVIPGTFNALIAELNAGNPVLILQNLGLDFAPSWHYAVVVGYDLDDESFILRSGPDPRMRMGYKVFERTWQRAERWAVVVSTPNRLPVSATADELIKSLVALERQDAKAAISGYKAALERWPERADFYIGLANARFGSGDVDGSVVVLTRLLVFAPDHVVALNNLANVLLKKGELNEARAYAARAAVLPGPWQKNVAQTLAEIDTAIAQRAQQ